METMYFGGYAAELPGQPVSGYVSMTPVNPQSTPFIANVSLGNNIDCPIINWTDNRYEILIPTRKY